MISSLICFREKTPANPKQVITFNAPGVYIPPYGKGSFQLQGQGQPGNAGIPGSISGYNPVSPGNYAGTNPATGGNYAYTNPAAPGNYAGTNPGYGGNYAYTNPTTGGNLAANGNANYNAQYTYGSAYVSYFSNFIGHWTYQTVYGEVLSSAVPAPSSYSNPGYDIQYTNYTPMCVSGTDLGDQYIQYFTPGGYWITSYNFWTAPHGTGPTPWSGPAPGYGNAVIINYSIWSANVQNITGYNPTYYNSVVPGNAVYNAYTPGNANYNPVTPGNANYNPNVPGNANYNSGIPGNASPASDVLGVTLPGGAAGTPAPVIGYVTVPISYSSSGVPIMVPPGGYVKIKNI